MPSVTARAKISASRPRIASIRLNGATPTFAKLAQPNPLQARALQLAENAPLNV